MELSMKDLHIELLQFRATIQIIGINPYVSVPEEILNQIFVQADRSKSPIAIHGLINERNFTQSLVKYKGHWRLYVNHLMLRNSPKHVGEQVTLSIAFNHSPPQFPPPELFKNTLQQNLKAKMVFDNLPPYLQKEINRYLSSLKSQTSLEKNVTKAIQFLLGNGPFIGRRKL